MTNKANVVEWHRSSRCAAGNCVEVAINPDGTVSLRDSKNPDGPTLTYSREDWATTLAALGTGAFRTEALRESLEQNT